MKKLLHVGCGPKSKLQTTAGFQGDEWIEIRFDIDENVSPDLVGTMIDMTSVQSETVDAIYSSHNIEHLYSHQVPIAMAEFYRVLKPSGYLVLTCPDLQSISELVAQDKLEEPVYVSNAGPIAPIDVLYGFRPFIKEGNHFMAHKTGFTKKSLIAKVEKANFARTASLRRGAPIFDLWILASKGMLGDEDLRQLAKAHFPL